MFAIERPSSSENVSLRRGVAVDSKSDLQFIYLRFELNIRRTGGKSLGNERLGRVNATGERSS